MRFLAKKCEKIELFFGNFSEGKIPKTEVRNPENPKSRSPKSRSPKPEMASVKTIEMFAIDGFEALVFTVCPTMVKREAIEALVRKANPTKTAAFQSEIANRIQDYSEAFLRTPRSLEKKPSEIEMAAIIETIRQFAKDDFRFGLFKKNLHLVFDLMTDSVKELHLINNGNLCKLLNETMEFLRASRNEERFDAKYSSDGKKVTFGLRNV
jgi:hypothetical protein